MVAGMMFSVPFGGPLQLVQSPLDGGAVALGPPRRHVGAQFGLHRRVDPQDGAARSPRRRGASGSADSVKQLTPTTWQLAGLDAPDPLGLAGHQPAT